jgi:Cu-Zn family superoxide dismutase
MSRFSLLLAFAFLLTACGDDGEDYTQDSFDPIEAGSGSSEEATAVFTTGASYATARLDPLGESSATGTVTFTETEEGLLVEYDLVGLELGEHGFHVHENGACGRGDDGTPGGAAGGHFNPLGSPHGSPEADRESRHIGDLGNVTSERGGVTGGVARGQFVDPLLSLSGPTSIIDRAMILHQGQDDLTSQPSGDAGDRIACGVVQLATPPGGA